MPLNGNFLRNLDFLKVSNLVKLFFGFVNSRFTLLVKVSSKFILKKTVRISGFALKEINHLLFVYSVSPFQNFIS